MGPSQVLAFRLVSYLALAWFAAGLAWRLFRLLRAPVPLKIPLTAESAPKAPLALGRDLLLFPRLKFAGPGLKAGVLLLHASLVVLFLAHLRYILTPVPEWVVWLRAPAYWSGWALVVAGFGLLVRRLALPPVLYLSRRQDFLLLFLFMALAASGLFLGSVGRADLFYVKQLVLGLFGGPPLAQPWPGALFWVHYGLFLLLLMLFPLSGLVHGLALFMNPVLRQKDDSRQRRKVNPWDQRLAGDRPGLAAAAPGGAKPFTRRKYRAWLKKRWAAAGTGQVLGAGERESEPSHGEGGHA